MVDFFSAIIQFMTDKTRRVGHKAILVLCVLTGFVLLDNILGFSYYYNNNKKLSQIEQVNVLLKDSTLKPEIRNELNKIEQDIVSHKSLKGQIVALFSEVGDSTKKNIIVETVPSEGRRNYIWHFISASWFCIIVMFIMPFILLSDRSMSLGQVVFAIIFSEGLSFGFAWLYARLLLLIPILFGEPVINYIVNFIITFLLSLLLAYLIRAKGKTKKEGA